MVLKEEENQTIEWVEIDPEAFTGTDESITHMKHGNDFNNCTALNHYYSDLKCSKMFFAMRTKWNF